MLHEPLNETCSTLGFAFLRYCFSFWYVCIIEDAHCLFKRKNLPSFQKIISLSSSRFDYSVCAKRVERFYPEIRKYYPNLKDDSLEPGYAGIRPKLSGAQQSAVDFVIQVVSANSCEHFLYKYVDLQYLDKSSNLYLFLV